MSTIIPPDTHTTTCQLQGPKKVSYTHEAMIDLIIADPTVSAQELATIYGYSSGWVSRIIASDSFQARLAARKTAVTDPELSATVTERMTAVTLQSLDIVQRKLAAEDSTALAIATLEMVTATVGRGSR